MDVEHRPLEYINRIFISGHKKKIERKKSATQAIFPSFYPYGLYTNRYGYNRRLNSLYSHHVKIELVIFRASNHRKMRIRRRRGWIRYSIRWTRITTIDSPWRNSGRVAKRTRGSYRR